jgi:hypothetical protein
VNINVLYVEEDFPAVFLFFHVMSGEVVGVCIGKAVGRRIKMSSFVQKGAASIWSGKFF